jgi:hypothetical protein
MSEPLTGQNYRALRRLSTAADETLAEVGETCERVPVESLAPLLASGHIELAVERRAPSAPAPDDATPPTGRKARK